MRKLLFWAAAGMLGAALAAPAQTADKDSNPTMGRGRGGAPYAWCDKDKDGICDVTGKPVGQGRDAAVRQGRGGRGHRWARGVRCCAPQARAFAAPAEPAK
jgi:hypothetical protein